MVILKKIRSATLVEALVATVLIIIIFIIASSILNNVVINTFSKNTHSIESRLNELEYQIQNNQIKFPYNETFENWDIAIGLEANGLKKISILATNKQNDMEILRHKNYDQ